jgi:hypothetical protein
MDQQPLIPEVLEPLDTPVERPAPTAKYSQFRRIENLDSGRRPGTTVDKYKVMHKLAHAHSIPLLERLICEAEAGDMLAMRIIMDRLWPRPRTIPVQVGIPATENPDDLRKAMHELLAQVAQGKLTTEDGQNLVGMMKNIIDTYRIDTVAPSAPGQASNGNAKLVLRQKLIRAIEARKNDTQNGESADPD